MATTTEEPRPSNLPEREPNVLSSSDSSAESDDEDMLPIMLNELAMDKVEALQDETEGNIVQSNWNDYHGRHKEFSFTRASGLQIDLDANITPLQTFSKIVDDEVLNLIVTETNRYAHQCLSIRRPSSSRRPNIWKTTDKEEMKKILTLLLWMGLVPIGSLKEYWSTTSQVYQFNFPHNMMSRNRFQELLTNIHFANNEDGDTNRLARIKNLLSILQTKFQTLYVPTEDMVIDESVVPFRGRLIFRQYIPNKAHRYGIKVFKLCATNGYTYALKYRQIRNRNPRSWTCTECLCRAVQQFDK